MVLSDNTLFLFLSLVSFEIVVLNLLYRRIWGRVFHFLNVVILLIGISLFCGANTNIFYNQPAYTPAEITFTFIYACTASLSILFQYLLFESMFPCPQQKFFRLPMYIVTAMALLSCVMMLPYISDLQLSGALYQTQLPWFRLSMLSVLIGAVLQIIFLLRNYKRIGLKESVLIIFFILVPYISIFIETPMNPYALNLMTMFLSNIFLYFLVDIRQRQIILQQEQKMQEQKFAIVRSQVQPHFLYNTISSIMNLCYEDAPAAAEALADFSDYLRQNIATTSGDTLIPFSTELSHIEAYLRLEKLRFGEKLSVIYNIKEDDFWIPAMMVQPLVENAVKHGITEHSGNGTVILSTYREGNAIIIEVTDDGIGFSPSEIQDDEKMHIGIRNVKHSLETILNGTLTITSQKNIGTTVKLQFKERRK